jgi:phosphatidylglycerol:prolipoprotein diacylglycerol transferase
MFSAPGPIAFQLGPLGIRWYGLLIAASVLLGTGLAHREALRRGEDADQLVNAIVVSVIAALVGARLYYILFNLDYYLAAPRKMVAVWEGGLAIHGGIIAGVGIGAWYLRRKGLPVLTYLDIVAPSLVLGQAIGRWGNFFNQEAFGAPTDLPWKLYIDPPHRPPALQAHEYFHPTFLYESLWNLATFAILYGGLRKRVQPRSGALFLAYLGLYSLGRFFIESLRVDSLMLGRFRVAQLVSLAFLLAAAIGLFLLGSRQRPPQPGSG